MRGENITDHSDDHCGANESVPLSVENYILALKWKIPLNFHLETWDFFV
jgi:hypothetical protein